MRYRIDEVIRAWVRCESGSELSLSACAPPSWLLPSGFHIPKGISGEPWLFRLLLLLLADAEFEMNHLGFLKRLVVVARHGVREVLADIGVFWQDRQQREIIVASRAERPEPLHIRNRHNSFYFNKKNLASSPVQNIPQASLSNLPEGSQTTVHQPFSPRLDSCRILM
jgi:hypothetical protein